MVVEEDQERAEALLRTHRQVGSKLSANRSSDASGQNSETDSHTSTLPKAKSEYLFQSRTTLMRNSNRWNSEVYEAAFKSMGTSHQ